MLRYKGRLIFKVVALAISLIPAIVTSVWLVFLRFDFEQRCASHIRSALVTTSLDDAKVHLDAAIAFMKGQNMQYDTGQVGEYYSDICSVRAMLDDESVKLNEVKSDLHFHLVYAARQPPDIMFYPRQSRRQFLAYGSMILVFVGIVYFFED